MNFSEKLTKLRKDNNLSQEALAEKLDVSRQSVSKWESGINYPEMDKLLSMCKIFNVTLEELTNDSVDINSLKPKEKNYFDSLIGEIAYIIDKTYDMFKNLNNGKRGKVLGELIVLFLILLLFKVPFNYVIKLGDRIFFSIESNASYILSNIWSFFINIVYLALFIITYLYIYKRYYLDKFESEEIKFLEKDEQNDVEEKVIVSKKDKSFHGTLFSAISVVISFCIKAFLILFILPFIVAFVFAVICLFMLVSLLFKGVLYFGLILCTIGGIALLGLFIDLIVSLIFNKKTNVYVLLIVLFSGLSVLGVGIGLSIIEISNTELIDKAPILDLKKETLTYEYDISDNLLISPLLMGIASVQEDDSLGDKIIIEVSYYKDIYDVYLNTYQAGEDSNYKRIEFYYNTHYSKEIIDDFLKNLKKKKVYDYSKLSENMIIVKASKSSIDKFDEITNDYLNEKVQSTNDYYSNRILELENKNELLNVKMSELEDENLSLKEELNNYKERIKELAE